MSGRSICLRRVVWDFARAWLDIRSASLPHLEDYGLELERQLESKWSSATGISVHSAPRTSFGRYTMGKCSGLDGSDTGLEP